MGVKKLWQLLSPAGKYELIESLRGLTLAVDANIWIMRVLHGTYDSPSTDVVLMSLFNKIVQLLEMGVRPVFVFDGPAPELKRRTLAKRRKQREDRVEILRKRIELHFANHLQGKSLDLQQKEEEEEWDWDWEDQEQRLTALDRLKRQTELRVLETYFNEASKEYPELKLGEVDFGQLTLQAKRELVKQVKEEADALAKNRVLNLTTTEDISRQEVDNYIRTIRIKAKVNQVKDSLNQEINASQEKKLLQSLKGQVGMDLTNYKEVKHGRFVTKEGDKYFVHLTKSFNSKRSREEQRQEERAKFRKLIKNKTTVDQEAGEKQIELEQPEDLASLKKGMFLEDFSYEVKRQQPLRQSSLSNLEQRSEQHESKNQILVWDHYLEEKVLDIRARRAQFQQGLKRATQVQKAQQIKQVHKALLLQQTSKQQLILTTLREQPINVQLSSETNRHKQLKNEMQTKTKTSQQSTDKIEITVSNDNTKAFTQQQEQDKQLKSRTTPVPPVPISEQQQKQIRDALTSLNRLRAIQILDFQALNEAVIELLQLFGLPYVQAPGQAEAQCAYLNQAGLVDGIITEDSDCLLFGGRRVYRGFFNTKPDTVTVQCYQTRTIQERLGLDRQKLIHLALLLGSDYTLGVRGVGIVNAIEIVAAFDSVQGLERLRAWACKADVLMPNPEDHYHNIVPKQLIYKEMHKNYKKSWLFEPDFPSQEVIEAYVFPLVDKSTQKLTFGEPAAEMLRLVGMQRFGWTAARMNSLLERLAQRTRKQTQITDFFGPVATIQSSRVQFALKNMQDQRRTGVRPRERSRQKS